MRGALTSLSIPKAQLNGNLPKKFPEDIEFIMRGVDPACGSLYISNIEAAENPDTLQKLRIGAVLSCAKGYELRHSVKVVPSYKYIPTIDHEQCDISVHFDEAVDFITGHLRSTNVLVHCIAGVSRSVSMVIAYFIREHRMDYDQAYCLVKARRKIIHPNEGFVQQLRKYSHSLNNSSSPMKTQQKSPQKGHQNTQKDDRINDSMGQDYLTALKSSRLGKDENMGGFQRSTTNIFTPSSGESFYLSKSPRKYLDQQKSASYEKKYSIRMNTESSPLKQQRAANDRNPSPSANRMAYFEDLNQELNEKIERIKRKYESDRQRLQTCYDMGSSRRKERNYLNAYVSPEEENLRSSLLSSRVEDLPAYSPQRTTTTQLLNQSYAKRYGMTSSPSKAAQPYYYRTIENSNLRENLNNISNRHLEGSNYDRMNTLSYSRIPSLYSSSYRSIA